MTANSSIELDRLASDLSLPWRARRERVRAVHAGMISLALGALGGAGSFVVLVLVLLALPDHDELQGALPLVVPEIAIGIDVALALAGVGLGIRALKRTRRRWGYAVTGLVLNGCVLAIHACLIAVLAVIPLKLP